MGGKPSDRGLTHTEKAALAKGLNFAVTPEEVPVRDHITASEKSIINNKLPQAEAEVGAQLYATPQTVMPKYSTS